MTNKKLVSITAKIEDRHKGEDVEHTYVVDEKTKIPVVLDSDGKLALTTAGKKIPRQCWYGTESPNEDAKAGEIAYRRYVIKIQEDIIHDLEHEPTEEEKAERELERAMKALEAKKAKLAKLKALREQTGSGEAVESEDDE